MKSPYNTYLVKGLPPGPINSPGEQALEAALAPAAGDWLYFVDHGSLPADHQVHRLVPAVPGVQARVPGVPEDGDAEAVRVADVGTDRSPRPGATRAAVLGHPIGHSLSPAPAPGGLRAAGAAVDVRRRRRHGRGPGRVRRWSRRVLGGAVPHHAAEDGGAGVRGRGDAVGRGGRGGQHRHLPLRRRGGGRQHRRAGPGGRPARRRAGVRPRRRRPSSAAGRPPGPRWPRWPGAAPATSPATSGAPGPPTTCGASARASACGSRSSRGTAPPRACSPTSSSRPRPAGAADELAGSVPLGAGVLLDVVYAPWPTALAAAWAAAPRGRSPPGSTCSSTRPHSRSPAGRGWTHRWRR